ncbi:hypothetical protein BURMUCGD1_0448 [Burkholderia multivorans CGD1]|nr:hypothetical protein BURMUCGD1_0448 [Burkholderia multivorans CGD1]
MQTAHARRLASRYATYGCAPTHRSASARDSPHGRAVRQRH